LPNFWQGVIALKTLHIRFIRARLAILGV